MATKSRRNWPLALGEMAVWQAAWEAIWDWYVMIYKGEGGLEGADVELFNDYLPEILSDIKQVVKLDLQKGVIWDADPEFLGARLALYGAEPLDAAGVLQAFGMDRDRALKLRAVAERAARGSIVDLYAVIGREAFGDVVYPHIDFILEDMLVEEASSLIGELYYRDDMVIHADKAASTQLATVGRILRGDMLQEEWEILGRLVIRAPERAELWWPPAAFKRDLETVWHDSIGKSLPISSAEDVLQAVEYMEGLLAVKSASKWPHPGEWSAPAWRKSRKLAK